MDSRQVIARFEAERQALAMMDHVNIARIFDGGTTAERDEGGGMRDEKDSRDYSDSSLIPHPSSLRSGRPYFVMELVHGVPITKYCDDNHLTPRERLELFVPVCQAIQHAHQKGIIHRDVKPSNVMITLYDGKPVPKVIDFGVAKATEQRLTERTLFTHYGTMVGTFQYMSPEQAEMSGLGVDTRSDIYSLGVLLYELLTGSTPLSGKRVREAGYAEVLRMIKEEEPPKPSTRLSDSGETLASISAQRRMEPAKLTQLVRGELDWIVMKALEKDRNRRYESASAFAADVQRYLDDEPVQACPPSAGYRLRKFYRRNKGPVLAASVVMLALVAGIIGTTWGMLRATDAEADAVLKAGQKETALQEKDGAFQAAQASARAAQEARDDLRVALYNSRANQIQTAWDANNLALVLELLRRQRPVAGEPDLRGFEWYYFDRLAHTERRTWKLPGPLASAPVLRGFPLRHRSFAFSPAENRYAAITLGADTQRSPAKVWDLSTGREVAELPGPAARFPDALALSSDGRRLALVFPRIRGGPPASGRLTVWDAVTRQEIFGVNGPFTTEIELSPDGRWVAARTLGQAGPLGVLKVWEVASGQELPPLEDPGILLPLAFSPDGTRLAVAGMSAGAGVATFNLQVCDRLTGKRVTTMAWSNAPALGGGVPLAVSFASTAAFSPDGRRLAAVRQADPAGKPGRVWDAATGKELLAFGVPATRNCRIAYSPDGQRLAVWPGDRDSVGQILDATTGEALQTLKGHTDPVIAVAFGPDGKRLYSADAQGVVKEWDVTAGDRPKPPAEPGAYTLRSRDGARQIVYVPVKIRGRPFKGATRPEVSVRDAGGKETLSFQEHKASLMRAQVSADGRFVYSEDRDGAVKVWEAATGQVRLSLRWEKGSRYPSPLVDDARESTPFSADGRRLVLPVPGGGVRVWELDPFRVIFTCEAKAGALEISPDGRKLVTVELTPDGRGQEGGLILWDVDAQKRLYTRRSDPAWCKYSPDGSRVAVMLTTGARGGPVRSPAVVVVLDTETGAELLTLKDNVEGWPMAFSPDGKLLATTARSTEGAGTILVWDVAAGKELPRLKGHSGAVLDLAFDRDGKRLASVARAGTPGAYEVNLWDVATGSVFLHEKKDGELWPAVGHCLSFSPSGHGLLGRDLARPDGSVETIWDATPRPEEPARR
jgi:WD40 repeat protein